MVAPTPAPLVVPAGARAGGVFPTFPTPRPLTRALAGAVPYPEGLLFDFTTGEVVLDGAGRPVRCAGHVAWAQWCAKAVLTQRGQSLAVGRRYGVDAERVRAQPTRAAGEAVLAAEITRALTRDRRTLDVRGITLRREPNAVRVVCRPVPRVGAPIGLTVTIAPEPQPPGGKGQIRSPR